MGRTAHWHLRAGHTRFSSSGRVNRLARVHVWVLLAAFLGGCALRGSSPGAPTPGDALPSAAPEGRPALLPELRAEILAMVEADQQARSRLVGMLASGQTPDSEAMAEASRHIEATDSLNRSRLREIVDRHGWPTRQQVGTDAMEGIFLLVQHASRDPDLQRRYLMWLERAYRAGELDGGAGQSLALLTDRLRINEGRGQLYGTQVSIEGGVVEVYPIEEPEAVDVRRAALGLPPLGEYLRLLREAHGLP